VIQLKSWMSRFFFLLAYVECILGRLIVLLVLIDILVLSLVLLIILFCGQILGVLAIWLLGLDRRVVGIYVIPEEFLDNNW
jgi:hypothetical protein